jgi:hypothetical protein
MQIGHKVSNLFEGLNFCWYPTDEGENLEDAIFKEAKRMGIRQLSAIILLENCLVAVKLLSTGELLYPRDFRRIVSKTALSLFELRIRMPLTGGLDQARLYFTVLESQRLAIGLVIRFKRLAGSRDQIRQWQNEDIEHAARLQNSALTEKFKKCLD